MATIMAWTCLVVPALPCGELADYGQRLDEGRRTRIVLEVLYHFRPPSTSGLWEIVLQPVPVLAKSVDLIEHPRKQSID
jgi:hypothetical protein